MRRLNYPTESVVARLPPTETPAEAKEEISERPERSERSKRS